MLSLLWVLIFALNLSASASTSLLTHTLVNLEGKHVQLKDIAQKRLIAIYSFGSGCPIVRGNITYINEISKTFHKDLDVILIAPNKHDSLESLRKESKEYALKQKVYLDQDQSFAKAIGFTRTAEVYLFNKKGMKLIYHGAINDRAGYGVTKPKATNNYLADAVQLTLDELEVKIKSTEFLGCLISYQ